jgi:hypothetical protein
MPLASDRDGVVVEDDELAVLRLLEIELDRVRPLGLREVEALERVLARPPRRAAMAHDPDGMRFFPVAHRARSYPMACRGLTINGMKRAILAFAAMLAAHPTPAAAVRLRVTVDPSLDGAGRSAHVYRCPGWSGAERNFPNFAQCAELRSVRFREHEVEIGDLPHELLYTLVDVDDPKRAYVKGRRVDLRATDLQRTEVAFEPATVSGTVMFRGDAPPRHSKSASSFPSADPPGHLRS